MTTAAPKVKVNSPVAWVKRSLFKNWWSGVITIVLAPTIAYLGFRALRFVLVTGQWEAVQVNLTLFMQGTFPRSEQWRLIAQIMLFALALGVGAGTRGASARDAAEDAGLPFVRESLGGTLRRMWSLIVFIGTLLVIASLDDVGGFFNPFLVVIGAAVIAYIGTFARLLPRSMRNVGWLITITLLVAGFQVVSGFDAGGWVPLGIVFGIAAYSAASVERLQAAWLRFVLRMAAGLVVVFLIRLIYAAVDSRGVGWDVWSGLHLTLMVSAIAIVLSFPLGLLLALARRSTLPALRWMATTYIELIRGVPLITLLFMGQFIFGFVVPSNIDLSDITKAIAAMTLFTAAYVAEIVRGGLQSLPRGQTEAGQALGMAPPAIMRRIVLPQALRAVIPAMVGQFISLFKDSSLLSIIAVLDFLGVRKIIHAQAAFRGVGIAETLVFVAFGYWAFAFAMSRESQRLERRLRVSR